MPRKQGYDAAVANEPRASVLSCFKGM